MLSEKLEQLKKSKILDFNLNFLVNREDKEKLDEIAKENKISTSHLMRLIIDEFLNEQLSKNQSKTEE